MGVLDVTNHYYFRMRNGSPYGIKVSIIEINTTIMHNYQEMTQEQKEFYLENPTATVMEVWNCELIPPYVPPEQDVQEYAAEKVEELKKVCYSTISVDKLHYAMANCVLAGTSITYTGKKHYTTNEAIAVMKTFMDESDKATTIYETYKHQIEAASTKKIVDNLYEEAIAQL